MSAQDEKVTPAAVPELSHENSSYSIDEKHAESGSDTTGHEVAKVDQGVDVVVGLLSGHAEDGSVDPMVGRRVRNKLDMRLIPLLMILYTLQFLDKNAIASSNILGILADAHLKPNDFNNLVTAFYAGYLIAVLPHAFLMQKLPIAKYIATNIMIWSLFTGLQCLCKSYGALFAVRFLLGMSESCVTTGVMTLISMFYTRLEITERIGWTFMCNGFAQIIGGFIAFGVAHISLNVNPHRWQWFMIIMTIISAFVSALWFWRMPDNPTSASFLTKEEQVIVVQRIKVNQNGVETKVWKKYQFIEAFMDPKTWIFFVFAAMAQLQGGIGVQYGAVIKALGFNTTQTTLLNIPSGFAQIIAVCIGGLLLRRFNDKRIILGVLGLCPGIIACIVCLTLPLSHKVGLVVQIYLLNMDTMGMVMILSLCATAFAGHTKKMTSNAIFFVGYAIGQMLNAQFWKVQYRPRNTVPWIIILCTLVADIALVLFLRWYLVRENKRRDAEKLASGKEYDEFGFIEVNRADGTVEKVKVPIQFLDITDKENKAFRYPM